MMAQDPLSELASPIDNSALDEGQLAIFDKVQYTYVNYAEVYWSDSEIRVAFGDDLPIGPIHPKVGLVMSVDYAKLLRQSLDEALDQWSKLTPSPADYDPQEGIPVKPGT